MINKVIPSLNISQENKKKLLNKIEKIYLYFNNKQEYRFKIKNINSKILMNKQITNNRRNKKKKR